MMNPTQSPLDQKNRQVAWTEFFSQYPLVQLPKKKILINASDRPTSIYYLQTGLVKQYSISEAGQELTLQIYKPGTYFYMSWLRDNAQSKYYFETLTEARLTKVPIDHIRRFLATKPELYEEINRRVFRGIDQLLFRLETLAFGTAATKVAATLLLLAQRFGKKNLSRNYD